MNPFLKSKLFRLKTKIYLFFNFLIKKLLQLVEFLLVLRFFLKFFNASQQALVVNLIFKLTEIFVYPFNFIFPNFYWKGFFVESQVLAAMLGYLIFAFFLLEVLKIIFQE
jgi:hypothetical protein